MITGGTNPVEADHVAYDNTVSGLTATNVQAAIDEVNAKIPTGPSGSYAKAPTVVSGTLTAGQTSVVLSNAAIVATSYVDIYTADGTAYTGISQAVGSVTVTFEAQAADLAVSAVVWDFT